MKTTKQATVEAQAPKQAKTIALSVIVPWFIIAVMAAAVAGVITGWFIHCDVVASTRGEIITLNASK